jgi:hypothetical protein
MRDFYTSTSSSRLTLAVLFFLLLATSNTLYAQGVACQTLYSSCMDVVASLQALCNESGDCNQAQLDEYSANCTSGESACSELYVWPQGKLVSILYMPPGNKSTVAYSSSTTMGTTDSLSQSFTGNSTVGLSFSVDGISLGASVTMTNTGTSTTQEQTTTQNTESTTWATSGDPIDHTQDVLTIWLNPQITVASYPNYVTTGNTNVEYLFGNAAYNPNSSSNGSVVNGDPIGSGDMSNINVTVHVLQNPTLLLPSQLVSRTNSDGTVVPGLLSLCAARMAESACTTAQAASNACGCTEADFSALIEQDPFFNPNISSPTIAAINAADPNGARFVPVKDSAGNDLEVPIQEGVTEAVTLTDTYNTSQTYTNTVSQGESANIGYSANAKEGSYSENFNLKASDGVTWSYTESMGSSSGTTHSQALVLATTSSSCYEYVNIYEDTMFHTFVFDNGSDATDPCP